MLPLEDEVGFLRQCADRFPLYADILRTMHAEAAPAPAGHDLATRVPLMAAVADAVGRRARRAGPAAAHRVRLPRGRARRGGSRIAVFARRAALRVRADGAVRLARHRPPARTRMNAIIVDQEPAVSALCDEFMLCAREPATCESRRGISWSARRGSGRTTSSRVSGGSSKAIWRVEIPTLTIEGPNYTYPSDINELRGATRGFIRSDEEGLLSAFQERAVEGPRFDHPRGRGRKSPPAAPDVLPFDPRPRDDDRQQGARARTSRTRSCFSPRTWGTATSSSGPRRSATGTTRRAGPVADADVRVRPAPRALPGVHEPGAHDPLQPADGGERRADPGPRVRADRLSAIARSTISTLVLDPAARRELLARGFSPPSAPGGWPPRSRASATSRSRSASGGTIAAGPKDSDAIVAWLRELRQAGAPVRSERGPARGAGAGAGAARLRGPPDRFQGRRRSSTSPRASRRVTREPLLDALCGLLRRTYALTAPLLPIGRYVIGDAGLRILYPNGQREVAFRERERGRDCWSATPATACARASTTPMR